MSGPVSQVYEMACPSCGLDSGLLVEATVICLITAGGAQPTDDKNPTWEDESPISCRCCGWNGEVGETKI